MNFFDPHFKILPPAQQKLWPQLKPTAALGFVLYGGTAIALQLAHRESIDFDFFCDREFNKELLREKFSFFEQATLLQDRKNSVTIALPTEEKQLIKISFFGGISFGRVGDPLQTRDQVLQIASLDDLMATKLKVIFQRIEAKDYLDIAAMIEAGISLSKGLASAALLFQPDFQPSESLKALTYFQGGDLHLLSSTTKQILIKAVQQVRDLPFLERRSQELAMR